ncbi:MAG: HupE/UreJ family protein [Rhodospirillaceae bacterium]|nr:HupE/UreJ family protein [Rhodospirillaceae bacterium]
MTSLSCARQGLAANRPAGVAGRALRERCRGFDSLERQKAAAILLAACTATVLWLVPHIAQAHIIHGNAGGFGSGFEHPLTGPDHFLAMFAVGLWGAQMGGRPVWTLPVAFPLIMVGGGILGILGIPIPGIETGIALSVIALGTAIAFAWHPPEWVALLLIGIFAVFHGHAHGTELPRAADPADYAIGFVVATGMIHVIGIGVGLGLNRLHGGKLARALGAAIALGGVYFLVA